MSKNVTTLDDAPVKTAASAGTKSVSSEENKAAHEAAVLIKHSARLSGKRKILTIHASNETGAQSFVFIGLNEVGYQVPRGKPFNVPAELVENLKNAVQTIYERDEDGKPVTRDAPRFAYTAEDAPDAEPLS